MIEAFKRELNKSLKSLKTRAVEGNEKHRSRPESRNKINKTQTRGNLENL